MSVFSRKHRKKFVNKPKVSKLKSKRFNPLSPTLPPTVFYPVKFLEAKALHIEGLFRISGDMAHVRAVKKELEKGKLKEFEKIVDVHIVAGVLKNFLIELEEPLLTFELSESFIKAVKIEDFELQQSCFKQAIEKLPPGNKVVLNAIMGLFHKIHLNSSKNKMDANNLSTIFAPTLISRGKNHSITQQLVDMVPAAKVIQTLIIYYEQLFLGKPYPQTSNTPPESEHFKRERKQRAQKDLKDFQNSLRYGTLKVAKNLFIKEKEKIEAQSIRGLLASESESLDEEALMTQLKQAKKQRGERKKVTEIFGEQTVSQTQTDTKSSRSGSSSSSGSGSAQNVKAHPNKVDIERPKPLASSTPISSSSTTNRQRSESDARVIDKSNPSQALKLRKSITTPLQEESSLSTSSERNTNISKSSSQMPVVSQEVHRLQRSNDSTKPRNTTSQTSDTKKPNSMILTSAESKTVSGADSKLSESSQPKSSLPPSISLSPPSPATLKRTAPSRPPPSPPPTDTPSQTPSKQHLIRESHSTTSETARNPIQSPQYHNTDEEVAMFIQTMLEMNEAKNASSGEESSDSESESESSNVSSGSGSLSTQPKKAGNVDSGSSKQESTSQQPRYLSSVDFNRIVEKCFQMVMLGDIGQIPDVLEMENLSPQQKVMIYDELQKKLDQLEKEET